MKRLILTIIPAFMLILSACNSAKVTSSWNGNNHTPVHFNNILIVGLFDDANRSLREQMESQLVQQLKNEGISAVSSYSLYGPKSFQQLTDEQALQAVKSNNIDGVITIALINKDKKRSYVYNNDPYGMYPYGPYGRWSYWYRPYYMGGFPGGHYEINVNYVFETNLYHLQDKKLIYSVQTKSYDPLTADALADGYTKSVIKDIRRNNVIG